MRKSVKILLFLFVAAGISALSFQVYSQSPELDKVEPPFWWAEMQNPDLQLLVYGKNIASTQVSVDYEGVTLNTVTQVENPNYLFVHLTVSKTAKAGEFPLVFSHNGKEVQRYTYQLKEREANSHLRKGFGPEDAIYLIMPDRFANGNPENDSMEGMLQAADRNDPAGRHGGDMAGIQQHLDYISDLGATAIWLTPFLENDQPKYSYHGYAITDFYQSDARIGTNEDYKAFVEACHQRNMKVIMDWVLNHCGSHHWFVEDLPMENWIHQFPEYTHTNFRAGVPLDPYSSEADLQKFLTGWFDRNMPDMNQNNQLLANYLIQATIWWIEYSGIDGIRLDTQAYSYKDMVSQWAKRIFEEYPYFNVVGEVWVDFPVATAYWQDNAPAHYGYDSNIPSNTDFVIKKAMEKAFNEKPGWETGLMRLYNTLGLDLLYANPEMNLAFADNHDIGRFYSTVNENYGSFQLGMAFLLTTRRIPMIYYGTEILMPNSEHHGHEGTRSDFPGGWPDDERSAFTEEGRTAEENAAFDYLQAIMQWRKDKEVIHTGQLTHFIPEDGVYVYFRHNENDVVMVVLNNNNEKDIDLDTQRFAEFTGNFTQATDIITGRNFSSIQTIPVKAKSALILELEQ